MLWLIRAKNENGKNIVMKTVAIFYIFGIATPTKY